MGIIKDWFSKEEKPKAEEELNEHSLDGFVKTSSPRIGKFYFKTTEDTSGRTRVEVRVFEESGTESHMDLATGTIIPKKYQEYTIYFFNYNNAEDAKKMLLDNVFNAARHSYNRGTKKRFYLD
jgi:hypothetical protein